MSCGGQERVGQGRRRDRCLGQEIIPSRWDRYLGISTKGTVPVVI